MNISSIHFFGTFLFDLLAFAEEPLTLQWRGRSAQKYDLRPRKWRSLSLIAIRSILSTWEHGARKYDSRVTVPMETCDRIRTHVSWTSSIVATRAISTVAQILTRWKAAKLCESEERRCSEGWDFIVGGISDCFLIINKREERCRDSIRKNLRDNGMFRMEGNRLIVETERFIIGVISDQPRGVQKCYTR